MRIKPIDRPPANFPAYVEDIATGLSGLYGPAAGESYRRIAQKAVEATMRSDEVKTWCAVVDGEAAGLAMAMYAADSGRVPFIHVLPPHCGKGIEDRLVREAVKSLRGGGIERITSECIPFCDINLRPVFQALGFQVYPRQLMMADTVLLSTPGESVMRSAVCSPMDMRAAGEALSAAYAAHAERELHPEVQQPVSAEEFIRRALRGAFGRSRPEYVRVVRQGNHIAGMIVGCEVAPGVGFILQVAVRPDSQGRGLGGILIGDLASAFLKRGMKRSALGVTLMNRARNLYLRLGFEPLRDVDAFVWTGP